MDFGLFLWKNVKRALAPRDVSWNKQAEKSEQMMHSPSNIIRFAISVLNRVIEAWLFFD
jgi:hypothetical protein